MDWTQRHCVPCAKGTPALDPARASELSRALDGWDTDGKKLHRALRFADFKAVMRFVNAVAELAEQENHHPDLSIHDWNRLDVTLSTHSIGGLSENDFIVAAKIDALPR